MPLLDTGCRRVIGFILLIVGLGVFPLSGCSPSHEKVDSRTFWFVGCSADNECDAGLSCNCSVCTTPCASESDCAGLHRAICSSTSSDSIEAQCGGRLDTKGAGFCAPECAADAECADGFCVNGSCVVRDYCDLVAVWASDDEQLEMMVSDSIDSFASRDEEMCISTAASRSPVRTDQLKCVARRSAREMARRRTTEPPAQSIEAGLTEVGFDEASWTGWQGQVDGTTNPVEDYGFAAISCGSLFGVDSEVPYAVGVYQGYTSVIFISGPSSQ